MSTVATDALLLQEGEGFVWELFHENSKTSVVEKHPVFGAHPSDAMVIRVMNQLRRVKAYADCPKVPLPEELASSRCSFDDVASTRDSARSFGGGFVTVAEVAKILTYSYGVPRTNDANDYPRPFRAIPSGGALYPLEVYLSAARVDGLASGIYHYDPEDETLDVLSLGDHTSEIASFLVQEELGRQAAVTLMVSAVFTRSVFKYGDRGYRFVLLEAGHLGQNALLTAHSLGLAAVSIGGYMDRWADRFLRLDGINESVVYMLHVGRSPIEDSAPAAPTSGRNSVKSSHHGSLR